MNDKYTRYKPRPGSAYATYSHQKQPQEKPLLWALILFGFGFLATILAWLILRG